MLTGFYACGSGQTSDRQDDSVTIAKLPDTLRVATLYSPTSYFIYKEERMGYDYSLVVYVHARKRHSP